MKLQDLVFLAADTLRSRAYAQAMLARNVAPGTCILVKSRGSSRPQDVAPGGASEPEGLFIPDLTVPLEETAAALFDDIQTYDAGTVNDQSVAEAIRASGARLVVYSGFGGEIVHNWVLEACPPFLHVHAGWLPDYRGSTTIYYGYLRERSFAASALVLKSQIDTGPIVARRRYPPPPPGMDVDHVYDSAIRADLLIRVVEYYAAEGRLPQPVEQEQGAGRVYYVIHPVLKHLVLNRLRGPGLDS